MITAAQDLKQGAGSGAEQSFSKQVISETAVGGAEGDGPESSAVTRMFTAGQIEGKNSTAVRLLQLDMTRN